MTRGSQAHAGGRDFEDRVQAAIREDLSTGDLQKKDVARELGISARSLDRELARGGTSYREIVERLRLKLAERDLTHTRCKLEDLSLPLGYANPSNFTRAFRRWTGETPRDFRNRVGAKWQDPPNRLVNTEEVGSRPTLDTGPSCRPRVIHNQFGASRQLVFLDGLAAVRDGL